MGQRQRHIAQSNADVIAECLKPGVSIAGVALAQGLDAKLLRKWVIDGERQRASVRCSVELAEEQAPAPQPTFLPSALQRSAVD